jgi:2',3'-cyclic-nucleotide 2'-phosphodiesterase (5'-nucleotidase family)
MLRKAFVTALLVGALGIVATHLKAQTANVTFLLVNDIYEMGDSGGRGGFPKLTTAVKAERAKGGTVIYVHAGDTISPSLLSGFDQGEHIMVLTNMEPPDIFVPGNHEYDFGPEVFVKRMGEATFPILAANLRDASGNRIAGIADTMMIEVGPAKIGIIGLTADDSPVKSTPGNLKIAPTVATAAALAKELRAAGADLVVAVAHASRGQDLEMLTGHTVDILLSGDDHDLMTFYDGRTIMVESMSDARVLVAVDVAITVKVDGDKRSVSWWPKVRTIDTADVEPDAAVAAKVAEYESELSKELDIAVGKTTTELDSRRASVRGGETAIGNLIADAMRHAVGADVAITNGGGIRGDKTYPAGSELTRRDILTELPFGNKNLLLEVSGQGVIDALENGVSQVENGAGRFPQISGLTFTLDASKSAGSRVSNVMVGDKPIDPAATYKVSTNDFMANGGDGYTVFRSAKVLLGTLDGKLMANDVMAYVRSMGEVSPSVGGRIAVK